MARPFVWFYGLWFFCLFIKSRTYQTTPRTLDGPDKEYEKKWHKSLEKRFEMLYPVFEDSLDKYLLWDGRRYPVDLVYKK